MSDDEGEFEEALAEIVRLHPERDLTDEDAPISTAPREPWCAHLRTVLHKETHRVTCRDCGREVDPFDVLVKLSGEWERYATFRKEAHRRASAAHERLAELLRLESNARARLKRIDPEAARNAPKKPWGDGSVLL